MPPLRPKGNLNWKPTATYLYYKLGLQLKTLPLNYSNCLVKPDSTQVPFALPRSRRPTRSACFPMVPQLHNSLRILCIVHVRDVVLESQVTILGRPDRRKLSVLFNDWALHGEDWGLTDIMAQAETANARRSSGTYRWMTREEFLIKLYSPEF